MLIDDTKTYEEEFRQYKDMAIPFEFLVATKRMLDCLWLDSIGLGSFRIVL